MGTNATRIREEALQLPEEERANLAADLMESLSSPIPLDHVSDEEWLAEIGRRADRAQNGQPGIPWEQVEANVHRRLNLK
jgi:putative addiction module component (TIGR02574 family)